MHCREFKPGTKICESIYHGAQDVKVELELLKKIVSCGDLPHQERLVPSPVGGSVGCINMGNIRCSQLLSWAEL